MTTPVAMVREARHRIEMWCRKRHPGLLDATPRIKNGTESLGVDSVPIGEGGGKHCETVEFTLVNG